MSYDATDPRATLAPPQSSSPGGDDGIAAAQYLEFDVLSPTEMSEAGSPSWHVRAQNLVLVHTHLKAGDSLVRDEQAHEYAAILPDPDASVSVSAGDESAAVDGVALIVLPPGASAITATTDTRVVRLFDSRDGDVLAQALNAQHYEEAHPRVALLEPWPAPADDQLRIYRVADVQAEPGRFGRIFRTSSFMVNFLDDQNGPRDPEKLSPHHHDDFEQISLAVEGSWLHHIRTPWTPKRSRWRDDEHVLVGSPSVAIIPPPTVHTSEAQHPGLNRLIDIFSPPRADFSAKPGWVLNAEEYPAP
ncbi:hypothetical protein [Mycetocola sp.]|uniref:hypothetical protein n=1 Tax=Mycetocola sp. TaxID=1871042 RepID=UPI00398A049B